MPPTPPNEEDVRIARDVLKNLDGTLMLDLRAMRCWAASREVRNFAFETCKPDGALGALNFGLAMTALVACETIGFYVTGAHLHEGKSGPRGLDSGGYIIEFICKFFPDRSPYKRVPKILADYARHDLVHAFGSRQATGSFDIALDVGGPDVASAPGMKAPVLRINVVTLSEHVQSAFNRVTDQVQRDGDLAKKIALAARHEFQEYPSAVVEQFQAFLGWEQREHRRLERDAGGGTS